MEIYSLCFFGSVQALGINNIVLSKNTCDLAIFGEKILIFRKLPYKENSKWDIYDDFHAKIDIGGNENNQVWIILGYIAVKGGLR